MAAPLYVGMGPPYVIRFTIDASDDFDPVVAAAASEIVLAITKPSGAAEEWDATVEAASADSITLAHALAVDDLDERGSYAVSAHFTLSGGGELRTLVGKTPHILGSNQPSS